MFQLQRYVAHRRPGKAADGPPYGPPGMWSTFAYHQTLPNAVAGADRVLDPALDGKLRDKANYRIVETTATGRFRNVYHPDGTVILPTATQRRELRRQLAAAA